MKTKMAVILLLLLTFLLTPHAHAGSNFLTNPGAELGISGWTPTHPNETGARRGISNNSRTVVSRRTGNKFFSVRGPSGTSKVLLKQRVDFTDYASVIDAGNATMTAQVYAFRYDPRDHLYLDVNFLNANGIVLEHHGNVRAPNEKDWKRLQHAGKLLPSSTRFIEVQLVGTISGTSSTLDAYFDDASLTVTVPELSVSRSSIGFGDVYAYDGVNASATTFNNNNRNQTFIITNTGSGQSPLTWSITPPNNVTVSKLSGILPYGDTQTITVQINPALTGSFTRNLTISASNAPDKTISLSATAHGFPATVRSTGPALGSNGRVNIGVGSLVTFKVTNSTASLFPGASAIGFDWQKALGTDTAPGTTWIPTTDTTKSYTFNEVGMYKVYARMRDSNAVGGNYVEIPVSVHALPVVSHTGSGASWRSDKYIGVVNQPITLNATSNRQPTTPLSTTGLTTSSKVGNGAGMFDGSASTDIDTGVSINLTNQSMTIAAWIKRDRVNTREWIISQGNGATNLGLHFGFTSENEFSFAFWANDLNVSTSTQVPVAVPVPVADTIGWHHWVGTYDAITNTRKLYVDGNEVDSDTNVVNYQGSGNLWIGSLFGTADFFDGNLDDVGIFTRALTPAQINTLKDQGLTGHEAGLVYFNTFDYEGSDSHKVSRYLWYDSDPTTTNATLLAQQTPGQMATHTFSLQNTNGTIYNVAATNHGIHSAPQAFNISVYPTLTVNAGEPYSGRPNTAVPLTGSVNSSGYSGATFSYQWNVDTNGDGTANQTLTTMSDPNQTYTWALDGTYTVALTVTATTQEGFTVTATDTSTVIIETGMPTALPGGSYRGGIEGGNFSPIQLSGGFVEPDGSTIQAWQWTTGSKERGLTFFEGDSMAVGTGASLSNLPDWTYSAWIKPLSTGADQAIYRLSTPFTFLMEVTPAGRINVDVWNRDRAGGDQWLRYRGSEVLFTFGQWQHLAVTLENGGVSTGTLRVYINGIERASGTQQRQTNEQTSAGHVSGPGENDDIAIFNRALTQTEIVAVMGGAIDGNDPTLVGYWPFEEGGGTTTADVSNNNHTGTLNGDPQWFGTSGQTNIQNPQRTYQVAGQLGIGLRVQASTNKFSPLASTTISVLDGTISGLVRAADLRTPVKDVAITLTSSHVDINALNRVANDHSTINTFTGGVQTLTNAQGVYTFNNLPLGSYTLVASKGVGDGTHEFETNKQVTELTLDAPRQLAIDYTDLSVFPIGGQIYYSILKNTAKVPVQDVRITSQPVGNASPITALASSSSLDASSQNYTLPLFAGKYHFDAIRDGHDIRLAGTTPTAETAIGTQHANYDSTLGLIQITDALTDLDFIDYTTRTITVTVEDSGGNAIDTFHGSPIQVDVIGTNGASAGSVVLKTSETAHTTYTATVPPGTYTVRLPNVPTAIVMGDSSKNTAELDVTGSDGSVSMVVPVKIQLAITPNPRLMGVNADFLANVGLTAQDNPEHYMFYYPAKPQEHRYIITATANGKRVSGFTLEVNDGISQLNSAPAPTLSYTETDGAYATVGSATTNDFVGQYTIKAGIPNASVVDATNPATFTTYTTAGGNTINVPIALPKTITFKASKAGFETSESTTLHVTVLGDLPEGSVSEIVSVPAVNYLVLHDPSGDKSHSYFDESMKVIGTLRHVTIQAKDGRAIPVYPSPWSDDRTISGENFATPDLNLLTMAHSNSTDDPDLNFETIGNSTDPDLGDRGLLHNRRDVTDRHLQSNSAAEHFSGAALAEGILGGVMTALGPVGYAAQFVRLPLANAFLTHGDAFGEFVQYEVSGNRFLRTPIEDEIDDLPDKMGPGKGDVYYGEGWDVGLQTKHRLGIKQDPFSSGKWVPDTAQILTYDILNTKNQYIYTVTDIERIIIDLNQQVQALASETEANKVKQRTQLTNHRNTWIKLLNKNPAYVWRRTHIEGKKLFSTESFNATLDNESSGLSADRTLLLKFLQEKFSGETGETLVFTGGTNFEYSRTMTEMDIIEYSSEIAIGTESSFYHFLSTEAGFKQFSNGVTLNFELSTALSLGSNQVLDKERQSGTETEQTVGFVLGDGDLWDAYTTYVHKGPWGTPIFFTDPGSVTSWPWEQGTVKGIDVQMTSLSADNNGPFDYRDGAHYQFKVRSTGKAVKEGSGFDYLFYDVPMGNPRSATVRFNGSEEAPYKMELFKGFSGTELISGVNANDGISVADADIMVSIYPPEKDWNNTGSFEYPVVVQSESAGDYQIAVNKVLRPVFADLRSPRATITAPYDGQRISPAVFTAAGVTIQIHSDDEDIAKIQLQSRTRQPDGVFQSWQNISGLVWEKGVTSNTAVPVVTHTNRDPQRREFTFTWAATDVTTLGVGEYQLRAVAQDAATRLSSGSQTANPNVDLDPPVVTFRVDASQPTVLTSTPFYQDTESQRFYKGELSITFTDDMTGDDFSDRTFSVVDLLNNSAKVAGIVSYSPTLRKAVFTPVTPLNSNGFYKATIMAGSAGVHDLAGNPLDNEFSWTFRTADSPFEETWAIALSVTDTRPATDASKLAAIAFGAHDGEDEKDARAVPRMSTQIALNFLHKQGTAIGATFERDTRPADGRLAHQWFFEVTNAAAGLVEIKWLPTLKLTRSARQYQVINLVEFNADGTVANTIALNPVGVNPAGSPVLAHSYTATAGEPRLFRLDVMKSAMVATTLTNGSTGWKFFSAPITPGNTDPFVNLGDDIDPFQLFHYDTAINGYKVYPFDLGQVSLQSGHGYFTRLQADVEVDVGGVKNTSDVTLTLASPGWHAIGNPFILPVDLDTLQVNNAAFHESTAVETTLHRWNVSTSSTDAYATIASNGNTATGDALQPWDGYFIKTKTANVTLTIPAPTGVADATSTLPNSFTSPSVAQHVDPGDGEFALTFALTAAHSADLSTALGTRDRAAHGYDRFDLSEPPHLTATASLYFEHPDWDKVGRRYNTDFKPALAVGDTAHWTVSVFTDTPQTSMELSWADAIREVPDDILVEFRPADSKGEWHDMRTEASVPITSDTRRTHIRYDIRATRMGQGKPLATRPAGAGYAQHVMLTGNRHYRR